MKTFPLLVACRSPLRRSFSVVHLALAFTFALSPATQAVTPPPDGGYPNNNTAEGTNALFNLAPGGGGIGDGDDNTAIGFDVLFKNTTGGWNTAAGSEALASNTTGVFNTATGFAALTSNTKGQGSTATGSQALQNNTTGSQNTATGLQALQNNTTGNINTAYGSFALNSNTTGGGNTAIGGVALISNTNGLFNTATGFAALGSNTHGQFNTATGSQALANNLTGNKNTAIGDFALLGNFTGSNNIALGSHAGFSLSTGSNNIALGSKAGSNLTTGNNNIDIGNGGLTDDADTIRIGRQGTQTDTFVAGISGSTVASGVGVIVGSAGKLGTILSSQRFKEAIKPMDKASEAILALKPVTFRYKHELDPDGIPQFGLVAEEVAKVNPDLVVRGEDGKLMTVRYEAVNAMLLNEFLKEHRNVAEQKSTIAELKTTVAEQQKQIEALAATMQKVSNRLALSKPAPQLVANP